MSQIKKQLLVNIIISVFFIIAAFIMGRFLLYMNSFDAGEERYILDREGNIIASISSATPLDTENYPNIGYTYSNHWKEGSELYRVVNGSYDIDSDENSIPENMSNAGYIRSFWDDFYYNSPKKDVIYQMAKKISFKSEVVDNRSFGMDDGNLFLFDIKTGRYGIADIRGNWILSPEYQGIDVSYADKGIIIVNKGSYYRRELGVIDLDYNILIEPDYEYIELKDDFIFAHRFEGYTSFYSLYDYEGNAIIGPYYGDIDFKDDFMIVEIDDTDGSDYVDPEDKRYGIYNYKGQELLEPVYTSISIEKQVRRIVVEDKESNYRLLDFELNDILGASYKSIKLVNQGEDNDMPFIFVIEDQNGKYYFCDPDGKLLSDNSYDYLEDIDGSGDFYIAKTNDKYGVIDCFGNIRLDFKYSELESQQYDQGYMIAVLDDQYGVIDICGETLIDFNYKKILRHNMYTKEMGDKYIVITNDNRTGVVTKDGENVIEPQDYRLYEGIKDNYDKGSYRYASDEDMLYFEFANNMWVVLKPDSLPEEFHFGSLEYLGGDLFLGKNYVDYKEKDYVIDASGNIIKEFNDFLYNVEVATVYDKTLLVMLENNHLTIMYDGSTVGELNDTVNFAHINNNMIEVSIDGMSGYKVYNYKGEYLGITDSDISMEIVAVKDEASGLYGLYDQDCNLLLDFEYEYIEVLRSDNDNKLEKGEVMAAVKTTDGKYGIVDAKGNWIYEPQFELASTSNGVIQVTLSKGQEIIK